MNFFKFILFSFSIAWVGPLSGKWAHAKEKDCVEDIAAMLQYYEDGGERPEKNFIVRVPADCQNKKFSIVKGALRDKILSALKEVGRSAHDGTSLAVVYGHLASPREEVVGSHSAGSSSITGSEFSKHSVAQCEAVVKKVIQRQKETWDLIDGTEFPATCREYATAYKNFVDSTSVSDYCSRPLFDLSSEMRSQVRKFTKHGSDEKALVANILIAEKTDVLRRFEARCRDYVALQYKLEQERRRMKK